MQCTRSGSSTPMGRDPNSRWVQWLALTRRNNPACLSGAVSSPTSSTSSLPMACSNLGDSGRVRSRSSATSYFALLSAAADAHQRQDGRKQHYSGSGTSTAGHMDSSWVAWLNERSLQLQGGGPVGDPMQSMPCTGHYASKPPVQSPCCFPDSTAMPSSPFHISAFTTPTPPSMDSGAETPFPSPLAPLTDADLDALSQQFPDFPDTPDGFPVCFTDSVAETDPFDPAELGAGLLTWLDEQHAFAFDLGEDAPVSPSKRGLNLEGYPAEMSA
ncbi:hypothetical protein IFM51744_06990 [Aspergillus udagawae]|nr:hypothetical protein IFM51744_06990 [Aspergillus udagawae]